MTPTVTIYEVGGFVRDHLLGIPSKDRDCTVVIDQPDLTVEEGLAILREWLTDNGYVIFVDTPEHATIRAHPPERTGLTADFVLARTEGPYTDGRRPDWVKVGTLSDDLRRRDFTVNAMARQVGTDDILDFHNGLMDLSTRTLRFVGEPMDRIIEDPLRVMRAIRFAVTKGFTLSPLTAAALADPHVPDLLCNVSEERRENELRNMFANARSTDVVQHLASFGTDMLDAMFTGRVRLTATLRKRG